MWVFILNVVNIPPEEVETQNYIAMCDLIVSKPGYGTVSEAIRAKIPMFLLKRDGVELPGKLTNKDGSEKNFSDSEAFENEADYTMTVIDACGYEYVSDIVASITYAVDPTFTFTPASGGEF